jgi:hypothetical protein
VRDDLRLIGRSFRAAKARWLGLALGGAAVCVLMGAVGQGVGGDPGYAFTEFRTEGLHSGVMTAVSAFFLGAGSMALFAVAAILRRRSEPMGSVAPWGLAACGLFLLGADDLLMLHEIVAHRLETRGWPRALGLPHERLAFVAYGVAAAAVFSRVLESLRRYWQALFPLVCALGLLVASEAIDLLVPVNAVSDGLATFVGPADRAAKTLGTLMMFAFAQTLLVAVATEATDAPRARLE